MKQPCEDNILGDEVQNGPIRRKDGGGTRFIFFLIQRKFSFQTLGRESGLRKKKKRLNKKQNNTTVGKCMI